MISKNSFLASMIENNKRRGWVWIVSMLFWFFYYPVVMAMIMSRKKGQNLLDKLTGDIAGTRLKEAADGWLQADGAVIVFVSLLAIVCAVQGFSYLYSKKKVDLYHSVPVSKTRRFTVIYINGILIFFIPYLLNMILAMLVAGVNGGMCAGNVRTAVISIAMNLILYAGTYGLAVIAVMLTGNVVITLFAAVIFLFYEIALRTLIMEYQTGFFDYFSYSAYKFSAVISPVWQHFSGVHALQDYIAGKSDGFAAILPILLCIAMAVIFGLIGYFCYRKRPSEAAGKTMAFPVTKAAVKILLTVPFTLYVGILVKEMVGSGRERSNTLLIVFIMAAAAIISSCVIEVIYELDIRAALRKKYQILITAACVAAVYCTFQFDLTGFDRWVPAPEKLDDAVIMIDNGMHSYVNENLQYADTQKYYLSKPGIQDIDAICRLSEKKAKIKDMEEGSFVWFDVAYRMKSGKIIWRNFPVNMEEEEILNKIIGNQELKNVAYQIYDDVIFDAIKQKDSFQITYNTGMNMENLSPDDADMIRQLYIKDFNTSDYSTFKNENICGVLTFSVRTNDYGTRYFEYDIYPSYMNIIGYLKEKGVYEEISSQWENIQSLTVTNYHYDMLLGDTGIYDKDWSVTKTFSDEQQIKDLAAALYPAAFNTRWMPRESIDSNYYVNIQFKNGMAGSGNYRVDGGYYLLAGKIPEWLKKDTTYE